ncbi:TonB family protein [Kangiella sp. M94]
MKIATKIACLLILFTTSILSHATFEDAVKHYEEGQFEKAYKEFQSLAEVGHQGAQFNLGILYLEGSGTQQDLVKAFSWIKLSDEDKGKETELLNEISQHFTDEKQKEADFFYETLHKTYSPEALRIALTPVYKPIELTSNKDKSPSLKPIKQRSPSYPRDAAMKGVEGWVIVSFYLNENGFPSDIAVDKAFPGDTFVKNTLNSIEDWQFEVPQDYDTKKQYKYKLEYQLNGGAAYKNALKSLKEKAEEGDAKSQYLYAKFGSEMLIEENFNPTVWYYKAAEQGIANAQYELANNLLDGEGCEEDKEKAIAWLIKSASGNLGRSHFKLAKLFLQLDDKERAHFWLGKAIDANDPEIAFELAKYIDDLGSEQYPLEVVSRVLQQAEVNAKVSPIRFYEYFADVSARLGDYESAAKYQFKANMALKRIANVPLRMREKLDEYQAKRENSKS